MNSSLTMNYTAQNILEKSPFCFSPGGDQPRWGNPITIPSRAHVSPVLLVLLLILSLAKRECFLLHSR